MVKKLICENIKRNCENLYKKISSKYSNIRGVDIDQIGENEYYRISLRYHDCCSESHIAEILSIDKKFVKTI